MPSARPSPGTTSRSVLAPCSHRGQRLPVLHRSSWAAARPPEFCRMTPSAISSDACRTVHFAARRGGSIAGQRFAVPPTCARSPLFDHEGTQGRGRPRAGASDGRCRGQIRRVGRRDARSVPPKTKSNSLSAHVKRQLDMSKSSSSSCRDRPAEVPGGAGIPPSAVPPIGLSPEATKGH